MTKSTTSITTTASNMSDYADEKQLELYKKFPSTHFLSNPKHVHHVLLWNTLFRRNLHLLARDYLLLNLHLYQIIILYFVGICRTLVMIASRATAKTYTIAVCGACICIAYPGTRFVVCAGQKSQAKLILSEKIEKELMGRSAALRAEIKYVKTNGNEIEAVFWNTSRMIVVVAGDGSRGTRSEFCVRDEFRLISEYINSKVLSPFQVYRSPGYISLDFYKNMEGVLKDPVDIYSSSSWLDNGHWMWGTVDRTFKEMLNGEGSFLLAFDESIPLLHRIKPREQLLKDAKSMDRLSFEIEIKNYRVKDNVSAFFTYSMLVKNQVLKKPFYPRLAYDVTENKKNIHSIPKQDGEIRLVSCDMAFVQRTGNDNSVFSCMRLIPDNNVYKSEDKSVKIIKGYHRYVPYIESRQGGDTDAQALRIRQLYEDFEADYIVLDVRNAGYAIYCALAKIMYDEERDCEYAPLACMNDEVLGDTIKNDNAKPVIYAVSASLKLNNDIAYAYREALKNNRIDFLVNLNTAKDEILPKYKNYLTEDIDAQIEFEKPFIETQLMISETADLVYEKKEQTGMIVISEQGNNTKDRYTSVSYGNYFAGLLERDLLSDYDEDLSSYTVSCVSEMSW